MTSSILRVSTLSLALWLLLPGAQPQAAAALPEPLLDAVRRAADNWDLDYADHPGPKVSAGGSFKGYRVILTRRYDEDIARNATGGGKLRFNHIDLVLVPQSKDFDPETALFAIPWSQAPEEYFAAVHWLGSGHGFEWFCRSDLTTLDDLRNALRLSGGDERLQLLAEALAVEDKDFRTADMAIARLKPYGKAALPSIVGAVSKMLADGKTPVSPMLALKAVALPEADSALVTYFSAGDSRLRSSAGNALLNPPFVGQAKDAYLRMLSDGIGVGPCLEACKQFGWKAEALPALDKILAEPKSLKDYELALLAQKSFRDGSVDTTALAAKDQILTFAVSGGDLPGTPKPFIFGDTNAAAKERVEAAARKRLKPFEDQMANAPDKDVAFLAALWLCLFQEAEASKDYVERVHASGYRVLQGLQRQKVEPALLRLSRKVQNVPEAEALAKALRRYQSGPALELPPAPSASSTSVATLKTVDQPAADSKVVKTVKQPPAKKP